MCRQMARGMGFRIRKLLLGSLFTGKTSVWMNLSPCISAGLSSIASFSTARCRARGKGSAHGCGWGSPLHPSWCLGRGSVVGVTVLFLWQQQQQHREGSSPPWARGVPVQAPGHSQEGAEGSQPQRSAVRQRGRGCLTPWR